MDFVRELNNVVRPKTSNHSFAWHLLWQSLLRHSTKTLLTPFRENSDRPHLNCNPDHQGSGESWTGWCWPDALLVFLRFGAICPDMSCSNENLHRKCLSIGTGIPICKMWTLCKGTVWQLTSGYGPGEGTTPWFYFAVPTGDPPHNTDFWYRHLVGLICAMGQTPKQLTCFSVKRLN